LTASETARRRFHAIVLPHLDDAYALARFLCGNGADAEDIVQDACLRALAALETQSVEQPRAWLLTIVRHVAFSFLARQNPRQRRETELADLENEGRLQAGDPAPDAEARMIAADEGATLREAIAGLPLPLRETLLMRVLNGLSYREIAAATDAPIGTVMSRLARARAALASILGGDK
jgi:RNA polymerase sigma-70 factor (ECF subfamily)